MGGITNTLGSSRLNQSILWFVTRRKKDVLNFDNAHFEPGELFEVMFASQQYSAQYRSFNFCASNY